jgi:integral membrane protein (TIGR01906 family)
VLLLTLTSSFYSIVYSYGWYMAEHASNDLPMDASEQSVLTRQIVDYLRDGTFAPVLDERERLHLVDVKALLEAGYFVHVSLIVLAFVLALALLFLDGLALLRAMLYSGIAIVCFVLLALLLGTQFSSLFLYFHEIAFDNDLWQLDPSVDRMIVLLPEEFFIDFAVAVLSRMGVAGASSIILSIILKKMRLDWHQ